MTLTMQRERSPKMEAASGSNQSGGEILSASYQPPALAAECQNPVAAFALMPLFQVFVFLQLLDGLTTVSVLEHGGYEANPIVNKMMGLGPVHGLVLAKLLVVVVAAAILYRRRERVLFIANYVYAGIVCWNMIALIFAA
jgi:hypothetical protein